MSDYRTCPHPFETLEKEEAVSSYRCPICRGRVCLTCRRYGDKGFMIPLVSWMSGRCDDCSRNLEQQQKIRRNFYSDRDARLARARCWDEGRAAAPDAANPYAEPDRFEKAALDAHPWLRDEVTS